MEDTKSPADSTVTLAHIMSAHDTNLYGTVHGGVVMKLVDDAAGAAAARHAGCPAVTASVDGMNFIAPARVGDLLTVSAQVEHAGRTSMDVGVRVTAERWNTSGPGTEVVTAHLTFVAVDADGTPHAVPALVPKTPEEQERHARAVERRTQRASARRTRGA
ncbi:acyl-CoA thioesterase [Streptomyces sp. 8L]|uniref:acyl-CoA thioesterase n=1 Tax=Streptomyces sp. 8L TaxID=2877242 RepID=UPI001CD1951C|nr:acyl-CoA thioesterase [Streptomyces sp. 8L]MCA1223486.1 acyl-CoA thioesterase [Streptomyces sp. 8L]